MLEFGDTIPSGSTLHADIAVFGAGAAGHQKAAYGKLPARVGDRAADCTAGKLFAN